MSDRTTTHHLLFPRELWRYSEKSRKLQTAYTIRLKSSAHEQFNDWVDHNIGYIPPIPPKELELIYLHLGENLKEGTIQARLNKLLAAIRLVADASDNTTVKITLALAWENLKLQAEYLDIFPKTITE